MDSKQLEIIRQHNSELIRLIKANVDVRTELEQNDILSEYEMESLDIEEHSMDRAYKLIGILKTRSTAKDGRLVYDVLIQVLEKYKQKAPAEILKLGQLEYDSTTSVPEKLDYTQDADTGNNINSTPYTQVPRPAASALETEYLNLINNKTVLSVTIEKPSSINQSLVFDDSVYKISPKKPGILLAINNRNFENCPPRNGAEHDAKYLKELWKDGLHYEIFRENEMNLENGTWTKQKMLNTIMDFRDYCNMTRMKPDSVVVFIGSHGQDNFILTSDKPKVGANGKLSHEKINFRKEILRQFYHDLCPGLKGIPIVFIINTCQLFEKVETDNIPNLGEVASDIFVVCAQAPGLSAARTASFGSVFLHCFAFVMMKLAKNKHLEEIVNEVALILQNLSLPGEDEHGNPVVQGQPTTNFGIGYRKKLYFPVFRDETVIEIDGVQK